jgi:hypothetical protein
VQKGLTVIGQFLQKQQPTTGVRVGVELWACASGGAAIMNIPAMSAASRSRNAAALGARRGVSTLSVPLPLCERSGTAHIVLPPELDPRGPESNFNPPTTRGVCKTKYVSSVPEGKSISQGDGLDAIDRHIPSARS